MRRCNQKPKGWLRGLFYVIEKGYFGCNIVLNNESELKIFLCKCLKTLKNDPAFRVKTQYETEIKLGSKVSFNLPLSLRKSSIRIGCRDYRQVIADLVLFQDTVFELKYYKIYNNRDSELLLNQMIGYSKCTGIKDVYGLVYEKQNNRFIFTKLINKKMRELEIITKYEEEECPYCYKKVAIKWPGIFVEHLDLGEKHRCIYSGEMVGSKLK